jgi:hypothetical protein
MEICNMLIAHQARRRAFLQQESSYFFINGSSQETLGIFHFLFSRLSIAMRSISVLKLTSTKGNQVTNKKSEAITASLFSYV